MYFVNDGFNICLILNNPIFDGKHLHTFCMNFKWKRRKTKISVEQYIYSFHNYRGNRRSTGFVVFKENKKECHFPYDLAWLLNFKVLVIVLIVSRISREKTEMVIFF